MTELRKIITATELALAQNIRRQVFVEEQGIPAALEYDDADERAIHTLLYVEGMAVATGRLLVDASAEGVMGRIAVLPDYRGRGLGAQIVRQLEVYATAAGVRRLILHPHAYLELFYTRLGYQTVPGGESTVGVHQLILMEKWLTA